MADKSPSVNLPPGEVIECCGRLIVLAGLGLDLVCLRAKDHEGGCIYGLRVLP